MSNEWFVLDPWTAALMRFLQALGFTRFLETFGRNWPFAMIGVLTVCLCLWFCVPRPRGD